MCITPAKEFHCTDGQNFTELALKYRGVALGCGCGQGILGEGLCALDPQGYTLSTFISTGPGTGAMAGLSFVPILATWWYIDVVNLHFKPSTMVAAASWWTMAGFQFAYGWFLIATDCTMPVAHGTLTNIWIAFFALHCLIVGYICNFKDPVGQITICIAVFAFVTISLGFLPVIFPALVLGKGAYIFWLGEAVSLTSMFGVTPLLLVFGYVDPRGAVANRGFADCSLMELQKSDLAAKQQYEVSWLRVELDDSVVHSSGAVGVNAEMEAQTVHAKDSQSNRMEEPLSNLAT